MRYPVVVLNFKCYSEALGKNALRLSQIAEKVAYETDVEIAVCPSILDLEMVVSQVNIPVFAQHVDPYPPGPYTGSIPVESLKLKRLTGSLLNHSEKRQLLLDISTAVNRLRENGLLSILCTGDQFTSMAGAALHPDMIAVEPPELIGTGIAVSKAKPEIVKEAVENVKRINDKVHVLCGAGISGPEDVSTSIELGAEGVLLSSAFVKSKDPEKLLRDIVAGVG
jgi:triosephosphate isomerase